MSPPPASAVAPEHAGAALSALLLHAARCVQAVQAGRSWNDALPSVPAGLRPGVQAVGFHALRHLGLARALVRQLLQSPPPPATQALLLVALALLAASDAHTPHPATPRYDAHTVVHQAVAAMHTLRRAHAGLVNACLRRFLREREALLTVAMADWEARYNHPAWWVKRLRRDHPQHWQAILAAAQQPAALVLRAHHPTASPARLAQALAAAGVAAHPVPEIGQPPRWPVPDALQLSRHVPVQTLPGYGQGWFAVQDPAAQLAAPLLLHELPAQLPPQRRAQPLRVLDACAAPGGKTAHLLAEAQRLGLRLELLALEIDPARLPRVAENLARLGHTGVQLRVADASQPPRWWDGRPFDAILLDAPCTASGIVRRHPDVRWLRRETDVDALARTQRQLLDALWPLLAPGGRLVYATCSVFKAEGQEQIDAFCARHPDARLGPAPGHLLPLPPSALPGTATDAAAGMADNAACAHDGFFYARLDKASF